MSRTHVFPYSPRKGTKGALLKNEFINPKIIKERAKKLRDHADMVSKKFEASQIGQIAEVLLEHKIKNYFYGYTKNYIKAKIKATPELNTNQRVKITLQKENFCK